VSEVTSEGDSGGYTFRQEEARMLSLLYKALEVGNEWRDQSLCGNTTTPDHWFASDGTLEAKEATDTCFSCPVREKCLEWASESKQKDGIWGGLPRSLRIQKGAGESRIKPHDYPKLVLLVNPYTTDEERSRFFIGNLTPCTGEDEHNE
jgi:WhiB family redox-sensing transcriptional regulator